MKFLRGHIVFRFLWLAMALHIFNGSVDTPDLLPQNVPEDLSVNDVESIVEFVLEDILNIENAIAEHDDNDTDEGSGSMTFKKGIDLSNPYSHLNITFANNQRFVCKHSLYKDNFHSQFHPELTTPPPKV